MKAAFAKTGKTICLATVAITLIIAAVVLFWLTQTGDRKIPFEEAAGQAEANFFQDYGRLYGERSPAFNLPALESSPATPDSAQAAVSERLQLEGSTAGLEADYDRLIRSALVTGFFYGLTFIFIILCFWSLRSGENRVNDFQAVIYILCLVFLSLVYDELAFQHIWPRTPAFHRYALPLFGWLTVSAYLAFIYNSCPEKRNYRRRVLWAVIICLAFSSFMLWRAAFRAYNAYLAVNLVLIGGYFHSGLILVTTERRDIRLAMAGASSRLLIIVWLGYCTWWRTTGKNDGWLDPDWAYNGVLVIEFVFRVWTTGRMVRRLRDQNRELTESRAVLESLSNTDGLTGLYNRRFFEEALVVTASLESPVCLIMMDVDNFKKFNDTYGHPEGDQVLIRLAQIIKKNIRLDCDLPCRYGGEEFAVLFSGRLEAAVDVAERIRRLFGQELQPIRGGHDKRLVTLSSGVVERGPNEPSLNFVKRADLALYRSKDGGRNRVSFTIWVGPDRPESTVKIFGPDRRRSYLKMPVPKIARP